ncbi:uncharacterized protein LOC124872988 [Girardinichthys multiradiatus]|uniref:uncharacterized protein LOC124872988 n=1 Tax=Girardinichthys multiradiatus TaxID=208333 RepID=UPI001FAE12B6|nr:uncharacterized protein LOC124872988 [Girardinichthys multiradiatus]
MHRGARKNKPETQLTEEPCAGDEEMEAGASTMAADTGGEDDKEPTLRDLTGILQAFMGQQEAREVKLNQKCEIQEQRFKALKHQFQLLQMEVQACTSPLPEPSSTNPETQEDDYEVVQWAQVISAPVNISSELQLPVDGQKQTGFFGLFLSLRVYKLLGIRSVRTTPYHPQTDGLTERFNQTLKQMLRQFVDETGSDWDQWLPYLLFAYREVPQASNGFSPFELLYGYESAGDTSDGQRDASPPASEGQPDASASVKSTEGPHDASTPAPSIEGQCDVPAKSTEGLLFLNSMRGSRANRLLFLSYVSGSRIPVPDASPSSVWGKGVGGGCVFFLAVGDVVCLCGCGGGVEDARDASLECFPLAWDLLPDLTGILPTIRASLPPGTTTCGQIR